MYCKNCGSEMADDAIFCSHCGTKLIEDTITDTVADHVDVPAPEEAAAPIQSPGKEMIREAVESASVAPAPAEEAPRKPFLEEMQWNVSEYPDSNTIEKTEDINFDWNADPEEIPEPAPAIPVVPPQPEVKEPARSAESARVAELFDRVVPSEETLRSNQETAAKMFGSL